MHDNIPEIPMLNPEQFSEPRTRICYPLMHSDTSDPSSALPSNVTSIEKGSSIVIEAIWSPLPSSCVFSQGHNHLSSFCRRSIVTISAACSSTGLLFACERCIRRTNVIQKPALQHPLKPNCSLTLEMIWGRYNIQKNKYMVICVVFMITSPIGSDYPSYTVDLYSTQSWSVKKKKKIFSSTY